MDFTQVLHTAQKNEKSKDQEVRYYSTKFEPPKKEKKSSNQLSENIKKFLAKKKAEEEKKSEEAKKKRDELLALRSQDKKATKRVNVMLKRTKSANQSVIDDAVDNNNTAVTLAGPLQPDEDDYGYVSQEASLFYAKMMEKYNKMPDDPKFDLTKKKVSTNLGNTKDRVKAALEKEKEDALLPHKRKRKQKDKKDEDEEGISYEAPDRNVDRNHSDKMDKEKMPPPKPKKPKLAAPILNFTELLKIAEKKQFEPVVIEKKEKDDERLLTKKQKLEIEKERESQQRREEKRKHQLSNGRIPKVGEKAKQVTSSNSSTKSPENTSEKQKIPKLNGSVNKPVSSNVNKQEAGKTSASKQDCSSKEKTAVKNSSGLSKKKKEMEELFPDNNRPGRKYLPGDMRYKPESETKKVPASDPQSKKHQETDHKTPLKAISSDNFSKKPLPSNSQQSQIKKVPTSDPKYSKEASLNNLKHSKETPSANIKSKDSLPKRNGIQKPSMEVQSKRYPSEDVKRKLPAKLPPKQFPPPDVRRSGSSKLVSNKGRILDDSEEEYDSEMDDFIDDGDAEEDISKYISEIFGYDRRRYKDIDEDDANMESSFAQQMREEVISTKIGKLEDLEEEKKEEEAKRKKMMMKKKMRR